MTPINDILLDDERRTDFLSKSNMPQSRVEKPNRFSLIARNAAFLLEVDMPIVKGTCPICNNDFMDYASNHRTYCSLKCAHVFVTSKEHQLKMTIGRKKSRRWQLWVKKLGKFNKGKRYSPATEFKKEHTPASKGKTLPGRSGINHHNWKDGRTFSANGYVLILKKDHPYPNNLHGYVFEHRIVKEKEIGRYLDPAERVHHINGIITDNRPENLMLFKSNSEHSKFHAKIRRGQ